jgi:hypothetical protein
LLPKRGDLLPKREREDPKEREGGWIAKKGEWDMAMGHFALSLSAPFIGGGDGCLYLLPPWGYELLKSPQTLQLDH